MIRDHQGALVATNAHHREHDCIEVVMAFPEFIAAFERWLSQRGLYLFPIPLPEGSESLPAYGVGFIDRTAS